MTSLLSLASVPRALVHRDTTGAVKLAANTVTGELLGARVLAEGAGDLVQAAAVALACGATVTEIAAMFHPYLTMAEALKLAAQAFLAAQTLDRDVGKLPCCAAWPCHTPQEEHTKGVRDMKRFTVPRVAHCSDGCRTWS